LTRAEFREVRGTFKEIVREAVVKLAEDAEERVLGGLVEVMEKQSRKGKGKKERKERKLSREGGVVGKRGGIRRHKDGRVKKSGRVDEEC
jgi:hypothetical protein